MPVAPTAPAKDATAEFTYTFAGWDSEISAVTGDATYTAVFTSEKNSYTITFVGENGDVLDTQTVEYGATPVAPTAPVKENTDEYTYTFAGWTPAVEAVTGDATYTATYSATKNAYTVTFNANGGSAVATQTIEYGAKVEEPTTSLDGWTCIGWFTADGKAWDFSTDVVTGNVELTAEWYDPSPDVDDGWNDQNGL